jgi:hypothetical protein
MPESSSPNSSSYAVAGPTHRATRWATARTRRRRRRARWCPTRTATASRRAARRRAGWRCTARARWAGARRRRYSRRSNTRWPTASTWSPSPSASAPRSRRTSSATRPHRAGRVPSAPARRARRLLRRERRAPPGHRRQHSAVDPHRRRVVHRPHLPVHHRPRQRHRPEGNKHITYVSSISSRSPLPCLLLLVISTGSCDKLLQPESQRRQVPSGVRGTGRRPVRAGCRGKVHTPPVQCRHGSHGCNYCTEPSDLTDRI